MINPELEFEFSIDPSSERTAFRVYWLIPERLTYFQGHFPGFPVLPGVATIDFTVEAIRRSAGATKSELRGIQSAKFLQLIRPGQDVTVDLKRTKEVGDSLSEWKAEWKVGEILVAELALLLSLSLSG